MSFGFAPPSESLQLGGLPLSLTDEKLTDIFNQYGQVLQAKMLDPIPGMPTRDAIMTMGNVDQAAWLVTNVNNNMPAGLETPITVQFMSVPQMAAPQVVLPPGALTAPTGGLNLMGALGGLLGGMPPQGGINLCGFAGAQNFAPQALANFGAPANLGAVGGSFQVGVPLTGTVKRWDDVKGFGFIVPDGGGPDVFVHIRELPEGNKLVNGCQVVFEAIEDPTKGPGRFRAKSCSGGVPKDAPGSMPEVAAPTVTDNLFVTGLPLEIEDDTIKTVFSQYGRIVSMKKLQNQPGKVDAAALIRMGSSDEAEWIVKNLHGNIPTGLQTPVNVRFAENKGAAMGKGGGRAQPY